jgi:hypothetical protein
MKGVRWAIVAGIFSGPEWHGDTLGSAADALIASQQEKTNA